VVAVGASTLITTHDGGIDSLSVHRSISLLLQISMPREADWLNSNSNYRLVRLSAAAAGLWRHVKKALSASRNLKCSLMARKPSRGPYSGPQKSARPGASAPVSGAALLQ
jgi:hypothetical protein